LQSSVFSPPRVPSSWRFSSPISFFSKVLTFLHHGTSTSRSSSFFCLRSPDSRIGTRVLLSFPPWSHSSVKVPPPLCPLRESFCLGRLFFHDLCIFCILSSVASGGGSYSPPIHVIWSDGVSPRNAAFPLSRDLLINRLTELRKITHVTVWPRILFFFLEIPSPSSFIETRRRPQCASQQLPSIYSRLLVLTGPSG